MPKKRGKPGRRPIKIPTDKAAVRKLMVLCRKQDREIQVLTEELVRVAGLLEVAKTAIGAKYLRTFN